MSVSQLMAQNSNTDCSCCSEVYNHFDFWIGNWNVYDKTDKLVGTNSIIKNYDNCLLQEAWISVGKNRGTSNNFYDRTDNTWNQIWVDNSGSILKLKGGLIGKVMVLKSKLIESEKGLYYNQISWTQNNDESVTQLWELYNEKNELITEIFLGIYKKKLN